MKIASRSVASLIALMAGVVTICSAEKQSVAVRFTIEASAYRSHYSDAAVITLEAQITRDLVQKLNQNIGFLTFTELGTGSSLYTLNVTLGVPDPGRPVATQGVLLYSSLTGLKGAVLKARWKWFKYRDPLSECFDPTDTGCRLPSESELSDELDVKFEAANYSELVKNILCDVPILIGQGKLLGPPVPGWVLPLRQTEICLDLQSQFRVAGTVPSPAAIIPGTFLAEMDGPYLASPDTAVFGMLLRGESDEDDRAKKPIFLQNPDSALVTAVYVAQYRRPLGGNCGGAIPPPATTDGGVQ